MNPIGAPAQGISEDNRDAEFLRLPSVLRRTGLGRSTIYRLIADQKFPAPVRLAGRAVGWRQTDLDVWSRTLTPVAH